MTKRKTTQKDQHLPGFQGLISLHCFLRHTLAHRNAMTPCAASDTHAVVSICSVVKHVVKVCKLNVKLTLCSLALFQDARPHNLEKNT